MDNFSGSKELAEYALQIGEANRKITTMPISGDTNDNLFALIPKGMEVVRINDKLPSFPDYKKEIVKLIDVSSFIGYFNEHKNEFSRIFANPIQEPYTFTGIIDYHGTNGSSANWCNHKVELILRHTDQYKFWKNNSGKSFSQEEFAEFLKDNRFDISAPDNAKLLELVMHLEATKECHAGGAVRTNKGQTLSFTEVTTAKHNNETVEVPDYLIIDIPVFQGGSSIKIQADFKFRLSQGRLTFAYRLLGLDSIIRETITDITNTIHEKTETSVYI